jgi:hypothetical protein
MIFRKHLNLIGGTFVPAGLTVLSADSIDPPTLGAAGVIAFVITHGPTASLIAPDWFRTGRDQSGPVVVDGPAAAFMRTLLNSPDFATTTYLDLTAAAADDRQWGDFMALMLNGGGLLPPSPVQVGFTTSQTTNSGAALFVFTGAVETWFWDMPYASLLFTGLQFGRSCLATWGITYSTTNDTDAFAAHLRLGTVAELHTELGSLLDTLDIPPTNNDLSVAIRSASISFPTLLALAAGSLKMTLINAGSPIETCTVVGITLSVQASNA